MPKHKFTHKEEAKGGKDSHMHEKPMHKMEKHEEEHKANKKKKPPHKKKHSK